MNELMHLTRAFCPTTSWFRGKKRGPRGKVDFSKVGRKSVPELGLELKLDAPGGHSYTPETHAPPAVAQTLVSHK